MENKELLTERENGVCTLALNRPEKKNSLSPQLVTQLLQALEEMAGDDSVRAIVIRGVGDKAFCAGYDIRSIPTSESGDVGKELEKVSPVESLFDCIYNYPYPVIAMLNGYAFGAGCEMAICCDIRIGTDDIRMGMPPAKLGLVYHWTGLQRFIQTIGLKNTKELFFTGRFFKGPRLKEIGLVDYLLPPAGLEEFVYQMAREIAANAPLAVKGTKRVINLLLQSAAMDQSAVAEAEAIALEAFGSEDLREGQLAFLEKRKPVFKGK
ncbi:MAG: enoyl-CoA hydratase/isomerase family protein [Deltaproteobacteria bacterium]|nr:enoyl-CoA hydratase/isomerase family protein [Deltaproteobacteria bacterium]